MALRKPCVRPCVQPCSPASDDTGSGNTCFHGSNRVSLKNGEKKLISELKTGESVLTMNEDGSQVFSPVILQLQQFPDQITTFHVIRTKMGHNLTLTPNHLIYTRNGNESTQHLSEFSSFRAVFASSLRNGDYVLVNDDTKGMTKDRVVSVSAVSLAGVYSPVTEQGNIIVENILASCYADFENHQLIHLAFAPFRWFHHGRKWFKSITEKEDGLEYDDMEDAHTRINLFHWYEKALFVAAKNLVPERMNW